MRSFDALRARLRSVAPVLALAAAVGCYRSGDGSDPDDAHPYFPVGLAVSDSGKWLFVANSNFDLRYNAGTVQALDLAGIASAARACGEKVAADPNAACHEGVDAATHSKASVRIGAFAADLRQTARYDAAGAAVPGAGRLLLPVRGDASLTAIDFDESAAGLTLRCAGTTATTGTRCAAGWRIGTDAAKSDRGLTLEGEPFGLALPERTAATSAELTRVGGLAAVVHQSSGNVSLFVDVARDGTPPPGKLAYILSGLSAGGTGIAALDAPGGYPRFLVTSRTQSNVLVVQYFPDTEQYARSAMVVTETVPISPQATGFDTRGVVVDPPPAGSARPTRVFLTNRTPAALVVGEVEAATKKLVFFENVPLPVGPSRIVRASIDGKTTLLIASFDAQTLVVYDPDARRVTNVLHTHRGPYAMAVDPVTKLGFVCNFTDSTIQVVELDPSKPAWQRIIYSVGVPSGPTR